MVLLLPVYQPDVRLLDLIGQAHAALPGTPIVVVDDGSDDQSVLDRAEALGCTVLRHGSNQGKGVALRTGFRHLLSAGADVVSADADGQHSIEDIARVCTRVGESRRLVLGSRFAVQEMPLRSRLGNTVTDALFRAATGRAVQDTQTGLRGYPAALLDWLLEVPGDRFEYEMNVLLRAAAEGLPIEQVRVDTTYLDGNSSSHFGAVSDAVRIYRPLLSVALRRATGGLVDEAGRPAGVPAARSAGGVVGGGEQGEQD